MEDNQKFPEQKAPEKNTDDAFVKVGEDGAPVIPESNKDKSSSIDSNEDSATTLDRR